MHLQDGRVGAALAGLDVANHPFFGDWVIVETKAALLWAGTTQTYKQTSVSEQLTRTKHTQTHISPSYAWSFFVPFFISCWPAWHKIWPCFVFQRRRLCHCSVVPLWYGKTVWRVTLLFRSNRNYFSLRKLLVHSIMILRFIFFLKIRLHIFSGCGAGVKPGCLSI